MQTDDLHFMHLAIEQAKKGQGRTSPNPCVGAVIVKNGVVVGQGYHRRAGTPHAEINAIADAGTSCVGATIYVTLEPCNHTGRTPPCSQAVVAAGFSRVVIGMADPNPVAGGGAGFLDSQGIEVELGICEEECRQLNYPFIKHCRTKLPWVVMKAGMSLDGKISRKKGQGGAITCTASKTRVHELRDQLDALLIGIDTALIDDPSLTTRLPEGGRDPLRVILDSSLRLPADAKMLRQESTAQTWIFCGLNASAERQKVLEQAGAVIHRTATDSQGRLHLEQVLLLLGRLDITSVLVEGGAAVHGSFLREKLVDQIFLFTAPYFIGDGGTSLLRGYSLDSNGAPLELTRIITEILGTDILIQGIVAGKL
jgi:diaminohydroxyphosphoribosylaminopyrimidine deaminase/5-amino-6-(5-phosphoribosylamino)uracil reductase